jgi:hypothetical protein
MVYFMLFIFLVFKLDTHPLPNVKYFEICALLGQYAAYSGNSLLTFWDSQLVPKHQ